MSKRILLLCFLHGFKGNDNTFGDFPRHLEGSVAKNLPDHHVSSVVYPKYETKGELGQSTEAFLEWLKERVMELRKEHLSNPWPPNDRNVGVILVAHSMGGFVASDALFRVLDEGHHHNPGEKPGPIFPFIQGVLAFDTPYNGLARSMFVYGAFSNYSKVSNVFNVMTALSAAAPATLSRLATKRATGAATRSFVGRSSNPGWKAWQIVAVRTGTVGAIAAGGVAAYTHRKKILEGVKSVRNLKKEDVVQGYQQSVDALGQGLAYINRGNVGESFAWLSDHFTFVGSLLKQNELNRRLERLTSLKGVGIKDFYASLGENGYWSGGYFVPERTFCAIPAKDQPAAKLFSRHVIEDVSDEIVGHINLFKPEKNKDYEKMMNDATHLVLDWFNDETDIWDDPKFAVAPPAESAETEMIAKAVDGGDVPEENDSANQKIPGNAEDGDPSIPDESPIDIAAAASLVPLPDDDDTDDKDGSKEQRQAYMRHLFGVAQQTGTNLRGYFPANVKLPSVGDMPKGFAMPNVSLPNVSLPNVSLPNMPSIPGVGSFWGKKAEKDDVSEGGGVDGKVDVAGDGGGVEVDGADKDTVKEGVKDAVDGGVGDAQGEENGTATGGGQKAQEGGRFLPLVGPKEDTAEVAAK